MKNIRWNLVLIGLLIFISVIYVNANQFGDPVIISPGPQTNYEGDTVSLQIIAYDLVGDNLTYSASGLPPNLAINTTGFILGTLDYDSSGTYSASTVTVTNTSNFANSTAFSWTVANVNRAPLLTNPGTQTNDEGTSISLHIIASDPDGDSLTYTSSNLPPGLLINTTGFITGSLDYNSAGTYPASTVNVSDPSGLNISATFSWIVTNVNRAPLLTNPGAQTNDEGTSVSLQIIALEPDDEALTYTSSNLPPGLSINTTGFITGTLDFSSAGVYSTSTVKVADPSGLNNSAFFTWIVNNVQNEFNVSGYLINELDGSSLKNWTVSIVNNSTNRSIITGNDGSYRFTGLNGTTYTITEELQLFWTNTSLKSKVITISGHDEQNVNFTNKPKVIVSDDFSAPVVNTSLWTIFNPRNDATFSLVGTGTRNALLKISIPSGLDHDVWITNNAPRIMQNVSNLDFEFEVKFQSQMSQMYQSQGVIIQENSNKFIRFDIFSDGFNTRKFAATFANGNPTVKENTIIGGASSTVPLYMRIKRAGDQWAMNYSPDGNNWTTGTAFSFSLNVTSVGPFAGNAGSTYVPPPANDGLIDYFFNKNSPIVPEDPAKFNLSGYKLNASDGKGIPNWRITITNGSTPINTLTNNDGFYQFTNLENGVYTVSEEERSGWKNFSARSLEINVIDQDTTNVNFTNQLIVKTYTVSGYNINTIDNTSLAGWNVTITNGSAATTRSTGVNGYYEFTNLINGTYTVSEELQIGWTNVTPLSRNIVIAGNNYTVNFTNRPISTFNISGYKINADDGRGIYGWNVTIRNSQIQISDLTDVNGYYEFTNVARGNYTIFEEMQSDWTNVTPASKEITLDRDIRVNFTNKLRAIVSDDFSSPALSPLWAIVDPLDDSTISVTGTGTKNAFLSISVPDTAQHEFKNGNRNAPRIMQNASNRDFEIEVKFQSQMTTINQMDGVIIQQDDNKSIRFNFESDWSFGDLTNIMVLTNDNQLYDVISTTSISGYPENRYMRIKRVGDQWTMNYSTDGVNWTTGATFSYVLNVTSVGPFAGQSGVAYISLPAYTGLIDYFFNTDSPIVPEDPAKFNLSGYKINASDGTGISGWNITLTDGSLQTTTTTGSNGFYQFTNLAEGTYTVVEEQRSGWTNVTPRSWEIKGIDQAIIKNFTNRPTVNTYKISGSNINTSDNTGIQGWTITINNGSTQTTTSTDATGYYEFAELFNGTYNVTEELRPGWINVTPLTQVITVNGKDNLSVDFSNQPRIYTYSLSGYKINASDNTGIAGWNITITNGLTQTTTSTDSNGYYEFTNLLNGTYTVSEELKTEWLNVTPLSQNRMILGRNEQNVNFRNRPLEIVSDDFSDGTFNTSIWTFINPRNDSTLTMAGTGTVDALLNITVPSGLDHDIWFGNNAPRIMQKAPNKDFEIEVKFQSILNRKYQSEGVLIQQDSTNYIRFDFETDGIYTKIFVATFANGAGTFKTMFNINNSSPNAIPLYMRVKRVGDQWTMNYSRDGSNWTPGYNFAYILRVTSVGAFIGNAGTPAPAHIGSIDYFYNNNSRIVPEDPSKYSISGYVTNASDGRGIPGWNITVKGDAVRTTVTNDTGFYNFPYLLNGQYTVFEELQPEWINVTPLFRDITIAGQGAPNVNFTNKPLVVVSDDFSSPSLGTPLWTIVDPRSDSTVTIIGTGTKNALLSISVPNNAQHEFKGGINFDAPRVMQNASNKDFELEVKFQSQMTANNQMEGVIIQADNSKSIRFNFEQDLVNTNIMALTNDNGSFQVMSTNSISGSPVPLYMRVKRVGDQWTMNYSTDGANWTTGATFSYVLKVTSVGPFVGQSGLPYFPPAYTGLIDYFFNMESPIIPEDPTKFNLSGYKINASDGTGISGWNITITDGSLQTTTTTGSNGFYQFTNLAQGTYTVVEEQRSGWTNVTPRSWEIKGIDQAIVKNFTNRPNLNTYKISGSKINNSDNTGIQGWTITINNGSTQTTTSTDATGYYEFTDLVNGSYDVTEEQRSGWINVSLLTQKITINGRDNLSVNFRNQPRSYTYSLSGYKINANNNTGIAGWNITITNGSTPITRSTDTNGYYEFINLLNGTYTISEELKTEWLNVTPLSQNRIISGRNEQNVNFTNKPLEIISDDFSNETLNPFWTFINPRNDSAFNLTGRGTKDALLNIMVPSGLDHDIWFGNNAPRIMQNAPNKDFEIEVKFQSILNKTYQSEGVIIQQDSNNYIRFDFESDVTYNKIFAATFSNSTKTAIAMYNINRSSSNPVNLSMRVKRIGNQWSMNYSIDGSNWTPGFNFAYILKVTSVGTFIGNAGTPAPAHTGLIDYFFNTKSPIIPEDPPLPGTTFNVSGFKRNESDKAGLPGWNIKISNSTMIVGNTVTDSDGSYKFTNITKGTYTVSEEMKSEWMNVTPLSQEIIVNYNDIYNVNFTNQPIIHSYNLSGYKINASDSTGIQGWSITISNGSMQSSKLTDASGYYKFTNLLNGTYSVTEESRLYWTNISPISRDITILGQDQQVNFTNMPITRTFNISGYKINGDAGSVIPGWNISLTNGSMTINTSTDNEGSYKFTNLVNGTYIIIEENRKGWKNITYAIQQITVSGNDVLNQNFINKPQGIVSDDFSNPALTASLWTKFNPLNDSTLTADGIGTSDVLFDITVPAGLAHDVWVVNNASRIMQNVNVNDFEVEVMFKSVINKTYQTQGIIVEQDKDNYIRFDFFSDGSFINVFAANFTNGSTPMTFFAQNGAVKNSTNPLYMRVKRVGDNWTQKYSTDGTNWTTSASFNVPLTVTSIGPFIANSAILGGNAPAFTGLIDYFFNIDSPVIPEDALKFNASGFNIEDTNYNGVSDAGEPGISGWNISLFNNNTGLKIDNTKTDLSGKYAFNNLANGTYRVTEETMGGYIATNSTSLVFSISGKDINNINFTNSPPKNFNVSGFKIEDKNRNGIWDAGEVGITNWKISLFNDSTGLEITNVMTDSSGKYAFYNLSKGAYRVTEETKLGYIASNSTSVVISVSNKDIKNLNFTNYITPKYNISGFKINDINMNGIWDAGEQGIPNWNISLYNSTTGIRVNSTKTDASGRYVFANVFRDIYTVTEITKPDYTATNSTSIVVNVSDKDINNINFTNSPIAIKIISQTGDLTVKVKQTATFNVVVAGTGPLSYQWQKNGVNIGTNSPYYTTLQTTLSDNGATYRVIVTNSAGSVTSNSSILTVRNIVSDDFNNGSLDTSIWTFINPLNDATYSITGAGTGNASFNINVPAGTLHDAWTTNTAPRIMQTADNTDFQVEAKFDSVMTTAIQIQGIIVEQDSSNYIRFDFIRTSATATNIYAGSFSSGIATQRINTAITSGSPLYLRINRTGSQWKEFYSYDSITWILAANFTQALTVNSVGPYAANAGTPVPAFTARIDYFFNSSSPVVSEDAVDTIPPIINLWYGNSQRFGQIGVPQWFVNILGNVNDRSAVALTYSLNGGNALPLTVGPDNMRLQSVGDFNIEIDRINLLCGNNTVVIRAVDSAGNMKNESMTIRYSCNNTWPKNYSINWNNVTNIQDVAQVVDGKWIVEGNSIHDSITGYDRVVAIGDITWANYEITAPITLNSPLDPYVSKGNFIGFGIRWQGHYDWDGKQPRNGWYPLGALAGYAYAGSNNYKLQIQGNYPYMIADDQSGMQLRVGVPYIFKMRVETLAAGNSVYSLKVWEQGTVEPDAYTISGYGVPGELKTGSATLMMHNADVSIGNVDITEVTKPPEPPTPPNISNVVVLPDSSSANIRWDTDKLATSKVSYGLSTTYENGSVVDGTLVMSHSITLTGLAPGKQYHYQINSTSAAGLSNNTSDLAFNTTTVSSYISDDFSAPTLDSRWTVINPRGDATISVIGNGTNDALLSIAVPGGIDHDVWTTNNAPRVMQSIQNKDFEIEMKFQSRTTLPYQEQGVIIQQDVSNYMRFDILSNSPSTTTANIFAESFANGIAKDPVQSNVPGIISTNPIWMKVTRTGNNWKQYYSNDGINWILAANFNYPMVVSSIGLFAGNAAGSTSPAFTSLVDYFFDTSSPIVPEDTPLPVSITVQPVNSTVFNGSAATFSVGASGTPPLRYQWKMNGVNITNATGPSYTTPVYLPDNGKKFSVVVSNGYGSVTSNEVTLSVIEITLQWWDAQRNFRIPVTVNAAQYERSEKPVEASVNFTRMLNILGKAGTFDENSIRVVETDHIGTVLSSTVPFQFDKDTDFNAATKASGTIVFMMNGRTPANTNRYYQVYFGLTGGSYSVLSVTPQVTLTDNVPDEGQLSYQIGAAGSTYYLQKQAGGLSSLVDASGNDWINFHSIPSNSAGGEYRGIPNIYAGGVFHPGWITGSSSIVTQGPLKIRVRSVTNDGLWECLWDFYPGYVTNTIVRAGTNYWWLYEGTPGGSLDQNTDFMVRSDSQNSLLSASINTDIPTNEWAYFSDPNVNRSLFVSHHEDDSFIDEYHPMTDAGGSMAVFGFGRTFPQSATLSSLSGPQHFTFGLMDGTEFIPGSKTINSAYKDLSITTGMVEQFDSASAPVIVTQPADSSVTSGNTATFSVGAMGQLLISYQWQKNNVNIPGETNASYATPPTTLSDNGATYRVVVTNAKGTVTSNQAILTVGALSNNNQLVILDVNYTHNNDTMAFSFFGPGNTPGDLVSPINYAGGTLYERLQVFTKPSTKTVNYQVCLFQDQLVEAKHACADYIRFTSTGTYYHNQQMTSLYQYYNVSWNRPLLDRMLVVKDVTGWPVDTRYGYDGNWSGASNLGLYYPMQVRYTAIIVPPGGGQPVWDNPPVITTQPANQNVTVGSTASFSVVASGQAPLYYQWQRNGVNINGEHNPNYTTPPTTSADNGARYRVIVTNDFGSVTSNEALITMPVDLTIPTVIASSPTGTNAPYAANITVNFSEAMNKSSAESAFSSIPAIAGGSFSWIGNNMIYTPVSNLAYNTTYNVTIGIGAKDLYGNNMSSKYQWQFTTKAQDLTPPSVIGNSPTGTNVPVTARLIVNFSEEMNQSSVISSFSINPPTTGSFGWIGNNMTYTPGLNLTYNTIYTVTIVTGAKDLAGNMLPAYSWQFTTVPDTMPPSVIGNTPIGTNVPVLSPINVTFSEAMDIASTELAFSTVPAIPGGNFSWNGNTMKYTPSTNLSYNMTYTVTIGTGAKDIAGNNIQAMVTWQFTTVSLQPNLISNPGFESGTTSWDFYTNGVPVWTTSAVSPGYGGTGNALRIVFSSTGTNMQAYQTGRVLEPNTRYRLSFAAYSTSGNDVIVDLLKDVSPYTGYGLYQRIYLTNNWQSFTTEFTTSGFTGTVTDGRFRFGFVGLAAAGDTYYIDDIRLEKVV